MKLAGAMKRKCCWNGGKIARILDQFGGPEQVMKHSDDGGGEQERNEAARKKGWDARNATRV